MGFGARSSRNPPCRMGALDIRRSVWLDRPMADAELVYVADPMCSWCWGFSSVVAELSATVPVTVMVGGLRPGTTQPLDDRTKAMIREHWSHVHEATGQPFDFAFFDRAEFVYDTEPACRAVVAARSLDASASVPFLAHLQRAFYSEGRDVTDAATLVELAGTFGLDRAAFEVCWRSDETVRATRRDFAHCREIGVTAYPALLGRLGETTRLITIGYHSKEATERLVERWLERAGAHGAAPRPSPA